MLFRAVLKQRFAPYSTPRIALGIWVPARDRYQIVHENKRYQMVFQDTGLGFARSDNLVMVRVYTSPRSEEQKTHFMAELARELRENCGVQGNDLMISLSPTAKVIGALPTAKRSISPVAVTPAPPLAAAPVAARLNQTPPKPALNDSQCIAQIWLDVLQPCDSQYRLTQNPAEGRRRR